MPSVSCTEGRVWRSVSQEYSIKCQDTQACVCWIEKLLCFHYGKFTLKQIQWYGPSHYLWTPSGQPVSQLLRVKGSTAATLKGWTPVVLPKYWPRERGEQSHVAFILPYVASPLSIHSEKLLIIENLSCVNTYFLLCKDVIVSSSEDSFYVFQDTSQFISGFRVSLRQLKKNSFHFLYRLCS